MTKLYLIRLLVFAEFALFFVAIIVYAVLLRVIKTSKSERLIRLLSAGQEQSLATIKEKIMSSTTKIKRIKVELFIVCGIVAVSLLALWYLSNARHLQISLHNEFYLLVILAIIPLSCFFLFIEYLYKIIVARIDELSNR